jgi:iron complex outermembrane receptor protein
MKYQLFPCILIFVSNGISGQVFDSDSAVHTMETIIVKAYEGNRRLTEVPAAVVYISRSQLNRFDNSSVLSAVNATPGVRMEERSPGSYRFNIRGSSLRSPFGVRNVKVYWNDIPFTDPGGNTYLNQLGIFNFHTLEIIKGPSGSLYGAGNGGTLLINPNPVISKEGLDINYSGGSFGLYNFNTQLQGGTEKISGDFNISRMHRDGYRHHTNMKRDIATWQMKWKASKKNRFVFNFLYGDLFYQTPGGLTATQFRENPKAARPAAGTFPSAQTAKAAIYQSMWLGGLTHHWSLHEKISTSTTLYGMRVNVENPTFRNYEIRDEPHWGGRSVFKWEPSPFVRFTAGAEWQKGKYNIRTYTNKNGMPGNLLTKDAVRNRNLLFFAQSDFSLQPDLNITAGASINNYRIGITRQNVPNPAVQSRTYKNEISPRVALSKRLLQDIWVYASVAKGFSPPTSAEVLPSNSVISTTLNAEQGVSYEAGFKTSWWKEKLYLEAGYFIYNLNNAIVQRRDASNADYFINAGSTRQKGLEWQLSCSIIRNEHKKLNRLLLRVAHSLYTFRYKEFKQLTSDYSGKRLPGVPENTVAGLLDVSFKSGPYLNITYFHSDQLALNDANTDFAGAYNLLGARVGWRIAGKEKNSAEVFIGGENLFDNRYSLGNDINAAAGRYFNTAPGISFYAGLSIHFKNKKGSAD